MSNEKSIPAEGIKGLKENFNADFISGFIVFLLALPLSIGISKASDFPPLMGLVTAIIGGLIAGIVSGSPLTIKGPAAGLIVIAVGAVADFGGDIQGWHLACGAIVVAGFLQILFGVFKFGKYTDVFPLSAIHGMLAAIGLIIILKQIPVLLDVDPSLAKGKKPLELLMMIPSFLKGLDPKASLVGVVCLWIMMGWNQMKVPYLNKIPAPLIVLLFSISAELMLNFQQTEPKYALLTIGDLVKDVKLNADFSGISQTGTFIKYVIMFALVGSLESLLTVKAVDLLDPYKRKSKSNQDIMATGFGNMISGLLGGLPMISEVARSSANVNNGAKTKWANVFHGLFILIFVLFASRYLELIPNTALAAMLITVGIRLAHPKEFLHMYKIGIEQLAIFLITIFFTLFEDLLVGIFVGILLKFIFHIFHGVPIKNFFTTPVEVSFNDQHYVLKLKGAAVFTNYLRLKDKMDAIPPGNKVTIDASEVKLIDHNVISNIRQFEREYVDGGGSFELVGTDALTPVSNHELSALKSKK